MFYNIKILAYCMLYFVIIFMNVIKNNIAYNALQISCSCTFRYVDMKMLSMCLAILITNYVTNESNFKFVPFASCCSLSSDC